MKYLFYIFLILFAFPTFSQEKEVARPKIGLVLSGGGAKGFAHIGAIQLLEECGIKPDFITGTSMGSIIGALYAMGYTPEEIKAISDTTDWTTVLSNTTELPNVTYTEKQYYGTYWVNLNLTKNGVELPGGLIEGQNLLEELSILSQPVHGIDNFLDFPIPFTCVATDIEKGIPVALNSGDITYAIRASMAIPTVFTPVEIDSLLLIDGGWTRNLPVQEALDMGADIIISVDVGAGLNKKEDLNNMLNILDQTAWILSSQDTKLQLEKSNYVISPPVRGFSTFDFDKLDSIIAYGYQEASKQRAEFEALAKRIYPSGRNEKVIQKINQIERFMIDEITVHGTKLTSDRFVRGRLKINPNKYYTSDEIHQKIKSLYGTLYYEKISFQLVPKNDHSQELIITLKENNPALLKFSLYYDSENSIGVNLNVTLRNILLENSRLFIDAFLSENPIVGAKYIKYIGVDQKAILFTKGKYTQDSRFQWENLFSQPAIYKYSEFNFSVGNAYTLKNSWMLGVEMGFNAALMKVKVNPDTIIKNWKQVSYPLNVFANLNTLDAVVFPKKGILFSANAKYLFGLNHSATLRDDFTLISQDQLDSITYLSPYFVFNLNYHQSIKLHEKFSIIAESSLKFSSTNDIGFNDVVKVGGISPTLSSSTSFWGLERSEFNVNQAFTATLGFQWNFFKDIYFIGKANYLDIEYPMNWVTPELNTETILIDNQSRKNLLSFGGEIAYKSPIGPIRFAMHQNIYSKDLNFFVGVGFNIHRLNNSF